MPDGNVFQGDINFGKSRDASFTGAVTTNYTYGPSARSDPLQALIGELRQQITAHERMLQDVEGLRASVDMLQEQVQGAQPRPGRLRALLASMSAMAGNVTAVSAAVSAVRDAIG